MKNEPFRDDAEKVINDGKSFLKFCPNWRDAILWEEWRQFGIQCFSEGIPFIALNAMYSWTVQKSMRSLLFKIAPGQSIRRFPL